MHHKGRNRHHWEYWNDMDPVSHRYESVEMPRRYLAEMVMDRRAACKVYQGKAYTDASPLAYFNRGHERDLMHPNTRRQLQYLLTMLSEQGEPETFRYIREELLTGKPFPWEQEAS